MCTTLAGPMQVAVRANAAPAGAKDPAPWNPRTFLCVNTCVDRPVETRRVATRGLIMKSCPDCDTRNTDTNLFCPECGHSFYDDEERPELKPKRVREFGPGSDAGKRERRIGAGPDISRLFKLIAVAVVIFLGLAAGITSFVVSREIERSSLVEVEAGTLWKCSECGKTYRDRVARLDVKKSQRYEYGIETVTGLCYDCKYGDLVGGYQDLVEGLSKKGHFAGYRMDIPEAAAIYINENPSQFPATGTDQDLRGISIEVDPRLVERDFEDYAGRPVEVGGRVTECDLVLWRDGSKATFIQLKPRNANGETDGLFLLVYKGAAPVLKGDDATCCVMPIDQVMRRSSGGEFKAVLCVAMDVKAGQPEDGPASTAPTR